MSRIWKKIGVFFVGGILPVLALYLFFLNRQFDPLLTDSISFDAKARIISTMDNTPIDLLSIGSSITLNNIGSKAIADQLGEKYSYFNAASWGLTMQDLRVMLPALLEKYEPKVILLASGPMDFEAPKIGVCTEDEFSWFISQEMTPYFYPKKHEFVCSIAA